MGRFARRSALAALLSVLALSGTASVSRAGGSEKYLYIWCGDQARKAPDFLAVVNFDQGSPDYGTLITTVPVPGAGSTGNEPHHVGLSKDGKVLWPVGGS